MSDNKTRTPPTDTQREEALRRFDLIVQHADHDANGINIGNICPAYLRHIDIQAIRAALQSPAHWGSAEWLEQNPLPVAPVVDVEALKEAEYTLTQIDPASYQSCKPEVRKAIRLIREAQGILKQKGQDGE